jgi:hypothetical protein
LIGPKINASLQTRGRLVPFRGAGFDVVVLSCAGVYKEREAVLRSRADSYENTRHFFFGCAFFSHHVGEAGLPGELPRSSVAAIAAWRGEKM